MKPGSATAHSLNPDQRLALKTAATHLKDRFAGAFSVETIELFLQASYDQFVDRAKFTNLPAVDGRAVRPPAAHRSELDDPQGQDVEGVRPVRDEIGERVKGLLAGLEVPVG